MRVTLIVSAIDSSGGFRVVATLGQQLLKRGHSVCVIAPQTRQLGFLTKLKTRLKGQRVFDNLGQSDFLGSLASVTIDHPAPLTAEDLPDADVVIGTWWKTMQWIKELPPEKGVKVHLVQDYEVWPPNDEATVDAILKYDCPKITISSYLYQILTDKLQISQVFLLPNAIDHSLFFAPERTKNSPITVGFTYSPDPRKGSDLIVKAVIQARATYPELNVLAFSYYKPLPSIPVPHWVDFHVDPGQDKIRLLYSACDAWLFGSRKEGFGLPILEALACRTPVIGMPAGAAPELLRDGAGILVADQDWQGMASAIIDLKSLPDAEWLEMSQKAHRRAQENQWDIVGTKLEQILMGLLLRQNT